MKPLFYYPSVVIGLRIQFDESLTEVTVTAPEESATNPSAASPEVSENPLFGTSNDLTFVADIVPKSATVELPAQRQAGKFKVELDWRTLPIDPRAIRAIGISIYAGLVDPAAFARGMTTPKSTAAILDWTKDGKPNRDRLLLMGSVDSLSMEHGDNGSTLSLEGRDLRSVFLDSPFPTNALARVNLDQPIDAVIRQILDIHAIQSRTPADNKIIVLCDAKDFPNGVIPKPYSPEDSTRVLAPAKKGSGKGRAQGAANAPQSQNSLSYWDLITNACQRVGAVAWFDGPDIRVRHGSGLFEQTDRKLSEGHSPFADGQQRSVKLANGKVYSFNYRNLVFGHDVESFNFEHKLTGRKETIVEVRSYNTDGDERGLSKVLARRWPKQKGVDPRKQRKAQHTTGDDSKENVIVVQRPGIKNPDQLVLVAKSIYEEIMRGEMKGSLKTKDLTSFGGDSSDPDLLKLRPGDAFRMGVDVKRFAAAGAVTPALTALAQMCGNSGASEADMIKRGIPPKLAKLLLATASDKVPGLSPYFYTNTVKYSWSIESGLSVEFDFSNYIVARNPPAEELPEIVQMVKVGDQPLSAQPK